MGSVTYTQFQRHIKWIKWHIERLCTDFSFLEEGVLVKHTNVFGTTMVSKVEKFIINHNFIGIDTGFDTFWYHEVEKPTEEEIKKFNGHVLVVSKTLK